MAVKRVVDPYAKINVNANQSEVLTQSLQHTMNPLDEIALEAALRLADAHQVRDIVAVSIGSIHSTETLRYALALGATRAIHVLTDKVLPSWHVAQILQCLVNQEQPNLVLMGKQATDTDSGQTPAMLAALLNWPQATAAVAMHYADDRLVVKQESELGAVTISLELPAVVSVDLCLNRSRYVPLTNLLLAAQKPLHQMNLDELELDLPPLTQILQVRLPTARPAGIRVNSVSELLDKLRHEAKVLFP